MSGTLDATGSNARFSRLDGVAISVDGSFALLGSTDADHRIRKLTLSTLEVTTLSGSATEFGNVNGIGTNARFNGPRYFVISHTGVSAYITDSGNHGIRVMIISTTSVSLLAGGTSTIGNFSDGVGSSAKFNSPYSSTISPDDSLLFVCDSGNHIIRKIITSSREVTTIAGTSGVSGSTDGRGTNAKFTSPYAITISYFDGSYLLVGGYSDNVVRKVTLSTFDVITIAGQGSTFGFVNSFGTNALFGGIQCLHLSRDETYVLVCDENNNMIRRISLSNMAVTTVAGLAKSHVDGVGTNAAFQEPLSLSLSPTGNYALVGDRMSNVVRKLDLFGKSSLSMKYLVDFL